MTLAPEALVRGAAMVEEPVEAVMVPVLVRDWPLVSRVPPARLMLPALVGKEPVTRSLVAAGMRMRAAAALVRGPARVSVAAVGSMVPVVLETGLLILPWPWSVPVLVMVPPARL